MDSVRPLEGFMSSKEEAALWYETCCILGYKFGIPDDVMLLYAEMAKKNIQLRKENKTDELEANMQALRRW